MSMDLSNNFNDQAFYPDVFAIGPNATKSLDDPSNQGAEQAVSFRHIIDSGEIQFKPYQLEVDLQSDDAYTRALGEVQKAVLERMAQNDDLQALLGQDSWDREDRIEWETTLSNFVSEEVDEIPGLGSYRTTRNPDTADSYQAEQLTDTPTQKLNDLAIDIENGTTTMEYDCDIMAVTEGIVIQRIEDAMLPQDAAQDDSYMQAASYYVATGLLTNIDMSAAIAQNGYHGYIITPVGGIIEATSDPDGGPGNYLRPNTNIDFDDLATGASFVDPDRAIYTHDFGQHDDLMSVVNDFQTRMAGEVQAMIGIVEENANLPEFQDAMQIMQVQLQQDEIPKEDYDRLNNYIQDSEVSDVFARLGEMSANVEGFAGILSDMSHVAVNDQYQGQIGLDEITQIQNFLIGQADRLSSAIGDLPLGTYTIPGDRLTVGPIIGPEIDNNQYMIESVNDNTIYNVRSYADDITPNIAELAPSAEEEQHSSDTRNNIINNMPS